MSKLVQVSVSKSFTQLAAKHIMQSNKLQSTVNIIGNKLVIKVEDVKLVAKVLERNVIPFKMSSIE